VLIKTVSVITAICSLILVLAIPYLILANIMIIKSVYNKTEISRDTLIANKRIFKITLLIGLVWVLADMYFKSL